ncbi:unnamed protein product [Pedinophyceae sp. YPF-701]|nr:unnamed protein product [Pedinophyceae sp. YPF-701]
MLEERTAAGALLEPYQGGTQLTASEFYSGIGGLHYGLKAARQDARVILSFDINDMANAVYEHNFGMKPRTVNLESVPVRLLSGGCATDIWLMSPPCQPYTRQGHRKGADDERARSFMGLIDKIRHLNRPPKYLLVENVVGFETSSTRDDLVARLDSAGYFHAEFITTPLQLGVPYSRPRYFLLARLKPLGAFPGFPPAHNGQAASSGIPGPRRARPTSLLPADGRPEALPIAPIREFLESDPTKHSPAALRFAPGGYTRGEGGGGNYGAQVAAPRGGGEQASGDGGGGAGREWPGPFAPYVVPESVIDRHGICFDIVTPGSRRTCCFTKAYSRYVKGAGSVLATARDASRLMRERGGLDAFEDWCYEGGDVRSTFQQGDPFLYLDRADGAGGGGAGGSGEGGSEGGELERARFKWDGSVDAMDLTWLRDLRLRYFTPKEVANLHSFPPAFAFPESVTLRQRYALLGNSVSAAVVADMCRFLLAA